MSIAIVETYGSSYRVLGPNQEVISGGCWSGYEFIGYSSKFMVWRNRGDVATVDEHGRKLGSNSIPDTAQILGITDSGFLVKNNPGDRTVLIYGPSCDPRGSRTY